MRMTATIFLSQKIYLYLLFIMIAIIPFFKIDSYIIHVIILFMYYASLGLAWNIIGGLAGQILLGQSVFIGLTGYTCLMLLIFFGIPIWIGMMISIVLVMAFSLMIGYPCFRLRGPFFSLATLSIAEAVKSLYMYFDKYTGGTFGLWIPKLGTNPHVGFYKLERIHEGSPWFYLQFEDKLPYYYIFMMTLIIATIVSLRVERSNFGLSLRAIKDDETAANCLGINTLWLKIKALMICAILTAIAATAYVLYVGYIEPFSIFSIDLSLTPIIVTILGGVEYTIGPILGALIYTPLSEYIRAQFGTTYAGAHLVILGAILIILALKSPQGLVLPILKRGRGLRKFFIRHKL